MGKPEFPPQGVGTPVCFLGRVPFSGYERAAAPLREAHRRGRLSPHVSSNFCDCYCRSNRSAAMKRAKTTEMTPFMVKKAALSFDKSSGLTRVCS